MRLNSAKINITDYLRPKTTSTANIYRPHLNKYFQTIHPELQEEWTQTRRNQILRQQYYQKLDKISLQYISSERNYRKDLLDYKDAIKTYAPKTRGTQLSAILGYFEDNGYDIPRKLKKDLYGKDQATRTEEYIPKSEDINKVLEHLTLHCTKLC